MECWERGANVLQNSPPHPPTKKSAKQISSDFWRILKLWLFMSFRYFHLDWSRSPCLTDIFGGFALHSSYLPLGPFLTSNLLNGSIFGTISIRQAVDLFPAGAISSACEPVSLRQRVGASWPLEMIKTSERGGTKTTNTVDKAKKHESIRHLVWPAVARAHQYVGQIYLSPWVAGIRSSITEWPMCRFNYLRKERCWN